jgi:hypothetical protein
MVAHKVWGSAHTVWDFAHTVWGSAHTVWDFAHTVWGSAHTAQAGGLGQEHLVQL